MAAAVEEVRRVVTQYASEGADKTVADLNAVAAAETNAARAGDDLATVTDVVTKRQTSASSALDRLRRTVDEEYRAQQAMAKGQATLDRALQQGIITAEEYNRVLGQLQTRYTTMGTAVVPLAQTAQATKLASHEVTNLTAQIQDIGVSLAGGQSPFTVMLQQGSQISALMGDRGLKSIFSGLGAAIVSLINPTTAVLAGFTALYFGASAAYKAIAGESKSVEDTIKEQDRLLKLLKGSYDEATGAATKWGQASGAAVFVQTTKALADAKKGMDALTESFVKGSSRFGLNPNDPIGKDVFLGVKAEFADFSATLSQFVNSARGASEVERLFDSIGEIGKANPALSETAAKLLEMLRPAAEAAGRVDVLESAMRALKGTADATDLSNIGLGQLKKDAEEAAKVIAELEGRLALVGKDRQQAINRELSRLGMGASLDDRARVAELAGQTYDREKAAQEAEKNAREAQQEAKRASDELAREGTKVWEETRTAAEAYATELANLNNLLEKGKIDQETYARAAGKAADELARAQDESRRKTLDKSNNPFDGFVLGAEEYIKTAGSLAKQTADLTTNLFSSMEEAFVQFVKTGKINFKDLVDAMIADLARFAARQAMMGFLNLLMPGGGASMGTVGATTGAVYVAGAHSGAGPGEASFHRLDNPAAYVNAPRYHSGRDPFGLMAGEQRAIIKSDEGVFTAGQMKALGARMGAPKIAVNVVNQGGGQVEVGQPKMGANGEIQLDVIVKKMLRQEFVRDMEQVGPLAKALKGRFGLNEARGMVR